MRPSGVRRSCGSVTHRTQACAYVASPPSDTPPRRLRGDPHTAAGGLGRRPAPLLYRSGQAEGGRSGSKPARGAHHRMQPVKAGARRRDRRRRRACDGRLEAADSRRPLAQKAPRRLGLRPRTPDVPSCRRRIRTRVRGRSHEGARVRQRAVCADPISLPQTLARHVTGGSAACREEPEAGHAVPGGRHSTSHVTPVLTVLTQLCGCHNVATG
jgi:hypothetical protein